MSFSISRGNEEVHARGQGSRVHRQARLRKIARYFATRPEDHRGVRRQKAGLRCVDQRHRPALRQGESLLQQNIKNRPLSPSLIHGTLKMLRQSLFEARRLKTSPFQHPIICLPVESRFKFENAHTRSKTNCSG